MASRPFLYREGWMSDLVVASGGAHFAIIYRTNDQLRIIRGRTGPQRHHLAALLGYRHFDWYNDELTTRDAQICKMLLGPHGLTIYKALRAKYELPKTELGG